MPEAIPSNNPELNLDSFEKEICVRQLQGDDFERIVALQRRCFPNMPPWQPAHLKSMLDIFPEGQTGIEVDGELVASACSLMVDFDLYSEWHDWMLISDGGYSRTHDPHSVPAEGGKKVSP